MVLPKSIPLPVTSCSTEANEQIVHGNVSNKVVSSRCRTFIDAVIWSVGKILISLQLQNPFLFPLHPFSSNFSNNIIVVSVNCINQLIRSTITMKLWIFRFKLSLCADYFLKNCYKSHYCRCFWMLAYIRITTHGILLLYRFMEKSTLSVAFL